MINPKSCNEESFKWAVIVALDNKENDHRPQTVSLLELYGNKYNQNGLEILIAIQKIGKSEKNSPGIAVNILFNRKAQHSSKIRN